MTPVTADDGKKEAFRLYSEGRYRESLALCNRLLESARDPALEILAATNLFSWGKLEDAEVYFRDLARRMPESSHIHSYLAKVLEQEGNDSAVAEYAAAVRLDPGNQDALRSYAASLIARKDERGALPVLKRLCTLGQRPDDLRYLTAALTRTGRAEEACALNQSPKGVKLKSREYAEALCATGRYREAADEAQGLYDETHDPATLRLCLAARARADPAFDPGTYASVLKEIPDPGIFLDYVNLLQDRGEYLRALATVKKLIALDKKPQHRLIACELSAALGDHVNALADYESLIRDELDAPCPSDALRQILSSYRHYMMAQLPKGEDLERFLARVSGDTNVICLAETAQMYCELGEVDMARSWYYRAYRADYLNGGLPYAEFLASLGNDRECEKVLLYILANVGRLADLSRVAAAVTKNERTLLRMRRLTGELIRRMEERRDMLGSDDRECLAVAYRSAATDALSREDFAACMENCLCGIDVLPAYPRECRTDDFLILVHRTKEQMLTDSPVIKAPRSEKPAAARQSVEALTEVMALSVPEQKILAFLVAHKRASETDLRRLLGTRRVAGIVNILIRKAKAQGIMLLEKKGMSAEGEVYEYCGA
ncbi:tetratricopeptide repeat protein [Methanoregula sp.]|uniref:tetratricopeptide repeat protein n=1 Tax=Methanoregula sp. TaxID=2052170 RepID=UPI003BAF72ED